MRPLELSLILLLLAAAALEAAYLKRAPPRWTGSFLILIPLVAACQIFLEGWRLHLLPAYLCIILLFAFRYGRFGFPFRVLLAGSVALGALASGVASYLFPVFVLPEPRGPYRVGTFVSYLVDPSRHERHSQSPSAPRELMIQVWYPAKDGPGERALYRDPRINNWKLLHLRWVRTHSFSNLAVADQPRAFPIVLFSPSSGGNRDQNTFETEELASQGYVVVGIDHPYSSSRVFFPDGRVARSVPWVDTSSRAAFEATTRKVELMVQDHVADARFVLDEMERWNQRDSKHLLAGRLDVTKTGVIGHSFGGALAAEACLSDSRILAGINMDGWMFGQAEKSGISKPFFFMLSDAPEPDRAQLDTLPESGRVMAERDIEHLQTIQNSLERYGGYELTLLGAGHFSYADMALFSRLSRFSGAGTLDPYRGYAIVNAFTLAFFDRYLRNQAAPLLDAGGFPGEVRYKQWKKNRSLTVAAR
jgi:dienelactone hydrolase